MSSPIVIVRYFQQRDDLVIGTSSEGHTCQAKDLTELEQRQRAMIQSEIDYLTLVLQNPNGITFRQESREDFMAPYGG